MSDLGLRSASLALGELEATPKYRALAASGTSRRFNSFRQRIEIIRAGCRAAALAAGEIEELQTELKALRADCRGPLLGGFRLFVDRALREISPTALILILQRDLL
jgi:hypothetical protein